MSVKPKSHAVKIVCCAIMHYHKCCSRIVNKDLSYIQYHTSSIPTYIYKALTYKDRSFISLLYTFILCFVAHNV